MSPERVADLPLMAFAFGVFALLLVAREAGGWLNRRIARAADDAARETADESFILSGVLGLLGLLVAFTFSMALHRYEARRAIVVAEANAISTAHMRASLLDDPARGQLTSVLHDYAKLRLRYGEVNARGKSAMAGEVAASQAAIAKAAIAGLRPYRTTQMYAPTIASLNEVLDVGVERQALIAARLPPRILGVLLLYAAVSALVLGYVLAGARAQHRFAAALLFALLTLAFTTILDLDRPQSGAIHIDQKPMRDVVAALRD